MEIAALVHRPLIDLEAEPGLAPSVLAEAALRWAALPGLPAWAPDQRPRPALIARLPVSALPEAIQARIAAAATPGEQLWAARLWLQLGRVDAARTQLARTDAGDADERGWRAVWRGTVDGVGRVMISAAASPAVRLAAVLDALDRGAAGPGGLDEARAIAGELDGRAARLAIARVMIRELAVREVSAGVVGELAASLIEARRGADAWVDFLLREAALRLHRAALGRGLGEVTSHAASAIALDPSGADTQLAAGDALSAAGHLAEARARYAAAARLGLVERTAALVRRIEIDPDARVAAVSDLLTGPRRASRAALAELHGSLQGSIVAGAARWAATVRTDDALDTAWPLPLERYRAFLDLQPPQHLSAGEVPPVTNHTPLLSAIAVREHRAPWFAEIHPQRATAAMFRRELERTAIVFGQPSGAASATYETWLDTGCPFDLRDRLQRATEQSPLERALIARLVSAMGFHVAAKQLLPDPDAPVKTPEDAFALASWIFAEQMQTTGYNVDLEPRFQQLYAQLGDDRRYLRMKVTAAINATVNAARRKNVEAMTRWRATSEATLAAYQALDEVGDFDKQLMVSRWYRSMGFLPFVTGDRPLLEADLAQWLGIAAELYARTDLDPRQRVIADDNYFPAVETAVRTHSYLGNHGKALALVEMLATKIDSIDAKTWLELGELRHKGGDVPGALDAYLRAAHLELPYGRLSWFNAGQCHEQLGQLEAAAECYRRSLAHWPTGVSPLRRLRDLGPRLGDSAAGWAAWAQRQPAWASLPAVSSAA